MTIKEAYYRKKDEIRKDKESALAEEVKRKACRALYSGVGSADWSELMRLFTNNPQQLSRLVAADGTNGHEMNLARVRLTVNSFIGLDIAPNIDHDLELLDSQLND